jgi:serine phosphatase RsbU (regulator of sigma subunit)
MREIHALPKVLFSGEDVSVALEKRGHSGLLRFAGTCSEGLVSWLPRGLRDAPAAVVLSFRELKSVDEAFLKAVVEGARRRPSMALVDPLPAEREALEKLGAGDRLPILSCEAALLENGSLPDSLAREKIGLSEVESRFRVNPLWRRVDQEHTWLCALCGVEVEDVQIEDVSRPTLPALRGVRRHLLEHCPAWKSGRQTALPASILDAFLVEINRRKGTAASERRRKMSREIESLQERVESMVDLEHSMEQAQRRQLHLIPLDPDPDAVADIAVVYHPLQSVSGDFLDFYSLSDNRFGVSIGDVSGHGVEAAILMGMAKMALRIRSQALGTPHEMMVLSNRDLFGEMRRSAFVTAFFALVNRETRKMTYVRMGHPPALLRRGSGDCEPLDAPGLPFGADDGKRFGTCVEEREIQLEPDDVILLYTDGVTEAEARGQQFGVERLYKALMAAPAREPAGAILRSVEETLDKYLDGTPHRDDVTMVCLKIR